MRISETILLALAHQQGKQNNNNAAGPTTHSEDSADPLELLRAKYTNFHQLVWRKRVVDFGCGLGQQAVALAQTEECDVLAVDTNSKTLEKAKQYAKGLQLPSGRLEFQERASRDRWGTFDVVISQNAMEHYPDPVAILEEMRRLLKPSGKLLITFGPPWFAPYGSHMDFFCNVPWLNLLFSERTVMTVRARFRNDGAVHYEDCESGLNKMSVAKFSRVVAASGLKMEYYRYDCVKGLNFLGKLPLLRELFINHVTCTLTVP
jgi:SAM-dependent methyltransferase